MGELTAGELRIEPVIYNQRGQGKPSLALTKWCPPNTHPGSPGFLIPSAMVAATRSMEDVEAEGRETILVALWEGSRPARGSGWAERERG